MPAIDTHSAGSFCWSELVTSDVDASLVFYGALFDWIPEEADLGDASRYVRCTLNGRPVAAMVQMSKEQVGCASMVNRGRGRVRRRPPRVRTSACWPLHRAAGAITLRRCRARHGARVWRT